jgi:CBS domain-containing protein
MTPADQVVSIRDDVSYKEIAGLLAEHRVNALPVLNENAQVIGVVSEADLLPKESGMEPRQTPWVVGRRQRMASLAKGSATTASQLMTAPAVTVGLNEDVVYAARLMEDRHVKQLPVTDEDGRLSGILSRQDILQLFVVPDAAIREEIAEEVIRGALWIDPTELDITVVDGIVHLHGEVETRSLAELAGTLAHRTDGVVDVVNRLTWARDDTRDRSLRSHAHGVFERRVG